MLSSKFSLGCFFPAAVPFEKHQQQQTLQQAQQQQQQQEQQQQQQQQLLLLLLQGLADLGRQWRSLSLNPNPKP